MLCSFTLQSEKNNLICVLTQIKLNYMSCIMTVLKVHIFVPCTIHFHVGPRLYDIPYFERTSIKELILYRNTSP